MHSHENRLVKYSFGNTEQLSVFLRKILNKLESFDCFNILAHQIGDHNLADCNVARGKNVIEGRLEGILKSGLDVERYGSIYSTTKLVTNTDEQDVERIVNYSMYDSCPRVVCLCAIPKYMYVDGRMIEFSSCDGTDHKFNNANLIKAYKKDVPPPDHFKCCLLDAVKTPKALSPKTLIAAFKINNNTNDISLCLPCTHFIYDENDITIYYNEQEQRLIELFRNAKTTNVYDAIAYAYSVESKWWQSLWDEDYS